MSDVGFYHLTRTDAGKALPQLLNRTLAAGQRALVRCADAARVAALDAALWDAADFLPHGTAKDGDPEIQPIWLTAADENPNGARFLFLLDGAGSAHLPEYDRVFDLFDGADEQAVAAARERWRAAKAAGHALAYWKQGPRGWEKAA